MWDVWFDGQIVYFNIEHPSIINKILQGWTRVWALFEVNLTQLDPFLDPEGQPDLLEPWKLGRKLDWAQKNGSDLAALLRMCKIQWVKQTYHTPVIIVRQMVYCWWDDNAGLRNGRDQVGQKTHFKSHRHCPTVYLTATTRVHCPNILCLVSF